MKPLLSIVIATKNRVPYCIKTIETILGYTNKDFELVVQDNTDTYELKEYVENNFLDNRFRYNYTPPPFSSIDNFNAALELATGEYVCLIGDDDSICSTIFETVAWANTNEIDSVCPKVFVDYYWPEAFGKGSIGYLNLPGFSNQRTQTFPASEIQDFVNDGMIDYMKFHLPKLYHGLVKKSRLEKIKEKNGYFLGGLSPDIYSAVALANIVSKHYTIDYPITIAGACKVSTTVAGLNGRHSGKLMDAPHFRDRAKYIWDKMIPRYYSVQTIWAESAMKAIHENEIPANLTLFSYKKMLAKSVIDSPLHKQFFLEQTLVKVQNPQLFRFRFTLTIPKMYLKIYCNKVVNKIKALTYRKSIRMSNVLNIYEATNKVNILLLKSSQNR